MRSSIISANGAKCLMEKFVEAVEIIFKQGNKNILVYNGDVFLLVSKVDVPVEIIMQVKWNKEGTYIKMKILFVLKPGEPVRLMITAEEGCKRWRLISRGSANIIDKRPPIIGSGFVR